MSPVQVLKKLPIDASIRGLIYPVGIRYPAKVWVVEPEGFGLAKNGIEDAPYPEIPAIRSAEDETTVPGCPAGLRVYEDDLAQIGRGTTLLLDPISVNDGRGAEEQRGKGDKDKEKRRKALKAIDF